MLIFLCTEHLHHPISLDLFENQLYWLSRETGELMKQDKFGRGVPVTIAKDLVNPTGVKGWLLERNRDFFPLINLLIKLSIYFSLPSAKI